jgi:hypothetical protein
MLTVGWYITLANTASSVVESSVGAGVEGLESIETAEECSADRIHWVVSVSLKLAEGVLATSGSGSLAVSGLCVEVGVCWAIQSLSETIGATEVRQAQIVGQVKSIGTSNTEWILAASWRGGLTLSCGNVVEGTSCALEGGKHTGGALEVSSTQVVCHIESITLSHTSRILASSWHGALALKCLLVELASGLTVSSRVLSSKTSK